MTLPLSRWTETFPEKLIPKIARKQKRGDDMSAKVYRGMLWVVIFCLLIEFAFAGTEEYTGTPVIELNGGEPNFTAEEISDHAYVVYSELDSLGRVGVAMACIGPEFPIGARSDISTIEPTGWINKQYEFIPGKYLYNRSHLIAHRFSGGGEVQKNLFTGTQYLNQDVMAKIEAAIADYVDRTGNHVMYRVTPNFRGNELVCRGIEIEAQSVEEESVKFHLYIFNFQPGVSIDYRTGDNCASPVSTEMPPTRMGPPPDGGSEVRAYVINTNTKRFHLPDCHSVQEMKPKNRLDYTGTREELIEQKYKPCGECNP